MNPPVHLLLLPIEAIDPSPYQVRRYFAQDKLAELARSIEREGLIEPIVARPKGARYELIVGARRWRAVRQFTSLNHILARLVEVDDRQARRMGAAENIQREDLSAVEGVEALVELVDAELADDELYVCLGMTSVERVKTLLGRLFSVRSNHGKGYQVRAEGQATTHRFMSRVEAIFAALPRPLAWSSFYSNDLPLVTQLDPEVREWAIANRLNKSQAKELNALKQEAPTTYQALMQVADTEQRIVVRAWGGLAPVTEGDEPRPLAEVSARELRTLRTEEQSQRRREERLIARWTSSALQSSQPALEQVTIHCADARRLQDYVDAPVHLVITSPPYNVGIEYGEHQDRMPWPAYLALLETVFVACHAVLVDGGRMAVVVPTGVARNPWIPVAAKVTELLAGCGFTLRGQIVWDKMTAADETAWGSFRLPTNPSLRDTTEVILVAHKGAPHLAIPAGVIQHDGTGRFSPFLQDSQLFLSLTKDHWPIAPENAQRVGHPTPFPVALPERLIRLYAYPGAHVLDPFAGSGSTAIAALHLGCRATLIERDATYCERARQRCASELRGSEEHRESAPDRPEGF